MVTEIHDNDKNVNKEKKTHLEALRVKHNRTGNTNKHPQLATSSRTVKPSIRRVATAR